MTDTNSSPVASFSRLAEDYDLWFTQILRALFFPKQVKHKPTNPVSVGSLPDLQDHFYSNEVIERLKSLQDDLHSAADKVLGSEDALSLTSFDAFVELFEGLESQLRRIEKDMLLSDFGIDRATGLRSSTVMMTELERELERRSRKGQPFSVAILRIDDPALRTDEKTLACVSAAIKKTVRSFDDGYVAGAGEFVISLKHSDAAGGLRFVSRFKEAMARLDTECKGFTVSSCVAEPLPGDEMKQFLKNVRADLDGLASEEMGAVAQHEEISPLDRFLQSLKGQDSPTK